MGDDKYVLRTGKITGKNRVKFSGDLPFKTGEDVVLIRKDDIIRMLQSELETLLSTGVSMPENLYRGKDISFTDALIVIDNEGNQRVFYLDRKIYSHDPSKYIMIRYETVEQALDEEEWPRL